MRMLLTPQAAWPGHSPGPSIWPCTAACLQHSLFCQSSCGALWKTSRDTKYGTNNRKCTPRSGSQDPQKTDTPLGRWGSKAPPPAKTRVPVTKQFYLWLGETEGSSGTDTSEVRVRVVDGIGGVGVEYTCRVMVLPLVARRHNTFPTPACLHQQHDQSSLTQRPDWEIKSFCVLNTSGMWKDTSECLVHS